MTSVRVSVCDQLQVGWGVSMLRVPWQQQRRRISHIFVQIARHCTLGCLSWEPWTDPLDPAAWTPAEETRLYKRCQRTFAKFHNMQYPMKAFSLLKESLLQLRISIKTLCLDGMSSRTYVKHKHTAHSIYIVFAAKHPQFHIFLLCLKACSEKCRNWLYESNSRHS